MNVETISIDGSIVEVKIRGGKQLQVMRLSHTSYDIAFSKWHSTLLSLHSQQTETRTNAKNRRIGCATHTSGRGFMEYRRIVHPRHNYRYSNYAVLAVVVWWSLCARNCNGYTQVHRYPHCISFHLRGDGYCNTLHGRNDLLHFRIFSYYYRERGICLRHNATLDIHPLLDLAEGARECRFPRMLRIVSRGGSRHDIR